jgi:hypothetical protein
METLGRLAVAAVLLVAAAAKLHSPIESADGLAALGFRSRQGRWAALLVAVVVEIGLAVAVLAGSERAIFAAAGLLTVYTLTMVGAILRGQVGAPCGCFGAGSRVSWSAVARNAALAIGFAAVAVLSV